MVFGGFSIAGRVAAGMATHLVGPGLQTMHGSLFTALPRVPLGPIIATPQPPMASLGGGGIGGSSGTGAGSGAGDTSGTEEANDPNKSSSLSAEGEIDADRLEEDLKKIKKIEKEIQEKEKAQKAEEEQLKKDQDKLDKEEQATTDDTKKKEFEQRQNKLEESKKKLEEEKKTTAEQREQLDTKIAPPFAQKDKEGAILKEGGNIQFLDKEQLQSLKDSFNTENLDTFNPTVIKNVKKALETFNKYRGEYRDNSIEEEKKKLDTVDEATQPQARNLRVKGPGQYTTPRLDLEYS